MADKTSSAKCGQKFRARIVNNILPPPSSSPSRTVFHALLEPIDNAPTTSRSTKRIRLVQLNFLYCTKHTHRRCSHPTMILLIDLILTFTYMHSVLTTQTR